MTYYEIRDGAMKPETEHKRAAKYIICAIITTMVILGIRGVAGLWIGY